MNDRVSDDSTKDRILDAAESIFAEKGFKGSSVRAITEKAGVNIAAVNYHFSSKTGLLEAICDRRLIPLNKLRSERIKGILSEAEKSKTTPRTKEVLRAFIEPTMKLKETEPGAKDFIAFIGRAFNDPDGTARDVFLKFMKPMAELLYRALSAALPDMPKELLFWRLQFAMGAFGHTMQGDMTGALKAFGIEADTKVSPLEMLLDFMTAGMESTYK
ncbi:MAG: TetR family transcriptional regulator [Deltaproteobacteria bacterium]|nr:TetR family transcriptional regulator [Deltaproteobacteria bacterium]